MFNVNVQLPQCYSLWMDFERCIHCYEQTGILPSGGPLSQEKWECTFLQTASASPRSFLRIPSCKPALVNLSSSYLDLNQTEWSTAFQPAQRQPDGRCEEAAVMSLLSNKEKMGCHGLLTACHFFNWTYRASLWQREGVAWAYVYILDKTAWLTSAEQNSVTVAEVLRTCLCTQRPVLSSKSWLHLLFQIVCKYGQG